MRYDIKQDYDSGLYRVVDTANRNAPLWGEEYADPPKPQNPFVLKNIIVTQYSHLESWIVKCLELVVVELYWLLLLLLIALSLDQYEESLRRRCRYSKRNVMAKNNINIPKLVGIYLVYT